MNVLLIVYMLCNSPQYMTLVLEDVAYMYKYNEEDLIEIRLINKDMDVYFLALDDFKGGQCL